MLTIEERIENRNKVIELINKLDMDAERFISYLDCPRSDFFNKPYNNFPEYAYEGSLCKYALDTYEMMKKAQTLVNATYTDEQLIEVALFKNLYRAELYEFAGKVVKRKTLVLYLVISVLVHIWSLKNLLIIWMTM